MVRCAGKPILSIAAGVRSRTEPEFGADIHSQCGVKLPTLAEVGNGQYGGRDGAVATTSAADARASNLEYMPGQGKSRLEMAVNPMLSTGVTGMTRGLQGVSQSAEDIAHLSGRHHVEQPESQPAPAGKIKDTAEALVSMLVYEREVQASAKVVQTADALIGMLLDTRI